MAFSKSGMRFFKSAMAFSESAMGFAASVMSHDRVANSTPGVVWSEPKSVPIGG
jgi:hypothetical protein